MQLFLTKDVDRSVLRQGFTIPVDKIEELKKALGIDLQKGERIPVNIKLNDAIYKTTLTNVDHSEKYAYREVWQIRYAENNGIAPVLRKKFASSWDYIDRQYKLTNKTVSMPENLREYIDIYISDTKELIFECKQNKEESYFEFLDYIGPTDSLTGYIKSYKLVLLKSLIKQMDASGKAEVYSVADAFKASYLDRINAGLIADKGVDPTIATPQNSSIEKIIALINRNPYDAFHKAGYLEVVDIDGKSYYQLKSEVVANLTDERKAELIDLLDKKIAFYYSKIDAGESVSSDEEEGEELSVKESVEIIKSFIASRGFSYNDDLIENFYLSLKSKPFLILAGTSGTGKTRLVRLFAEAIGATTENGRYKLVSVRPDWSDSSDLFGHVNLQGDFVPGAIIDFIKSAMDDLDHPYFLCMDEMNLARVEYYLSDFLSIIETRDRQGDNIVTDEILIENPASEKYEGLYLPENLYLIGTVNMDETTFPFSKKVLDRANTIEFSYVDLVPEFSETQDAETLELTNEFLKTRYLKFVHDIEIEDREYVIKICRELEDINGILRKANAHVGYRVRDEIVFYMLNNKKDVLISEKEAFDNEIMQKILPRIQGSGVAVKKLLEELFKKFAGDYTGISSNEVWDQMHAYMQKNKCRYQKSAEKICYMIRKFEEDGFTSYWL